MDHDGDPQEQGAHLEGCPYCRVLYPGTDPCPRCDGRHRFEPARMLDAEGIGRAVRGAADRFAAELSRERLDALLGLLHVYAPLGTAALEARGGTMLDDLRLADRMLLPDLRGQTKAQVRAMFGEPERASPSEWTYRGRGAANHHRLDTVLRFRGGRVAEQLGERVAVACEPGGPL